MRFKIIQGHHFQ